MEISLWHINDIAQLAESYNQQVASIPFCYPVTGEELRRDVWSWEKEASGYDLYSEKLIVGLRDSRIVGFAHLAGLEEKRKDSPDAGLIRFLSYKPGHRKLGQRILEAAENYFEELGLDRIQAFFPKIYSFYRFDVPSLSDRMAHIHGLFGANGYKKYSGWYFMNRSLIETDSVLKVPRIASGLEELVRTSNGESNLPSLNIKLCRDRRTVAEIQCFSAGMQIHAPAAQECAYIAGLNVSKADQSKGLGAFLLRRSLHELHKCGYENAILNTRFDNYRAQLLYSNTGFQVVDLTYSYFNYTPA